MMAISSHGNGVLQVTPNIPFNIIQFHEQMNYTPKYRKTFSGVSLNIDKTINSTASVRIDTNIQQTVTELGKNLFDKDKRVANYSERTSDYTITHDGNREILKFRQAATSFIILDEGEALPDTIYTLTIEGRPVTASAVDFGIEYVSENFTYLDGTPFGVKENS